MPSYVVKVGTLYPDVTTLISAAVLVNGDIIKIDGSAGIITEPAPIDLSPYTPIYIQSIIPGVRESWVFPVSIVSEIVASVIQFTDLDISFNTTAPSIQFNAYGQLSFIRCMVSSPLNIMISAAANFDLVVDNSIVIASDFAGALAFTNLILVNNVFYSFSGTGNILSSGSPPPLGAIKIYNNIFSNYQQLWNGIPSVSYPAGIDYNDYFMVDNNWPGFGPSLPPPVPNNLVGVDPLFGIGFHLQAGSPCLASGIGPGASPYIYDRDIDYTIRAGLTTDIGAYEQPPIPPSGASSAFTVNPVAVGGSTLFGTAIAAGTGPFTVRFYGPTGLIVTHTGIVGMSDVIAISPVTPQDFGKYYATWQNSAGGPVSSPFVFLTALAPFHFIWHFERN